MHISVNTAEEISSLDKKILSVLAGGEVATVSVLAGGEVATVSVDTNPGSKTSTTPAPAKKTAATKSTPAPEPEPDDVKKEAIALATEMVGSGQAAKVKEALKSVGATKVREVDEAKFGAFYAALTA